MLEVFDGFGAHLLSLKLMAARYDNKIIALKEDINLLDINQVYAKYVAKEDKVSKVESLAMLQYVKHIDKGFVYQWRIVHVGLYAVRSMKQETWTRSFRACNMDPIVRLTFPGWANKIEWVLHTGQSFKSEEDGFGGQIDTYSLLPSLRYGVIPDDNKAIVAIVEKHGE